MRTATTIAKTHKGKWILVHNPDADIYKQRDFFRLAKASPTNDEYSEIHYQESDSEARIARFITKEAFQRVKEDTAKRQDELDAAQKSRQEAAEKRQADLVSFRRNQRIEAFKLAAERTKKRLKAQGQLTPEAAKEVDQDLERKLGELEQKPETKPESEIPTEIVGADDVKKVLS